MGPHPAVAELRAAVRRCLEDLGPGDLVLAACSGGADSLALAASLAFVAPRQGLRAGGVTVDHQLQAGSARQAARVAAQLASLGLAPADVVPVTVGGPGGPEAAARAARYRALDDVSVAAGAAAVLLGHTRDDQAETVLLGLARGSGSRSLAGMAERTGRYRRPFLAIGRDRTRAACAALGLEVWEDPHNADSGYARARVRQHALPALEAALGPGVAEALARTAGQLRADADALDELASQAVRRLAQPGPAMSVDDLAALPAALRTRVLRRTAIMAGCPPGSLTARHTASLDDLVTGWHGQRWVDLPGGVRGVRQCGKLRFSTAGRPRSMPPGTQDTEGADGLERHGCRPQGGADQPGTATGADRGARGAG
jgi:tRNA(Ile)-lysidine synthase